MPKFRYQAVDDAGRHGEREAPSQPAIRNSKPRLADKQLTLVSSRVHTDGLLGKSILGERIGERDVIEFYHRLYQTLELGLPMLSALEENAVQLPSRAMRRIMDEMRMAIENGNTFTAAMSRFPKVFDRLELAIIRMGEQIWCTTQMSQRSVRLSRMERGYPLHGQTGRHLPVVRSHRHRGGDWRLGRLRAAPAGRPAGAQWG
jgi:type II secretory pathway component PulF